MEEYRVSPRLFNEVEWIKFTKYEIIEVGDEFYIKPAKNGKMEYYHPREKSPEIVLDLIQTASNLKKCDNRINEAKEVLKFVNKYGLLGLIWYFAPDFSFREKIASNQDEKEEFDMKMELIKNGINNANCEEEKKRLQRQLQKLIDEVYVYCIRLRGGNPFNDVLMDKFAPDSDFYTYEWKYQEYASIFFPLMDSPYPSDEEFDNVDFWQNYCEPLYAYKYLLMRSTQSIFRWAKNFEQLENGTVTLDDYLFPESNDGPDWREMMENTVIIEGVKIRLAIDDEGTKEIDYITPSLYDSICLMFFQDKASKNQLIKQCKNEKCKDWFIAKSSKAQYCSTACASSVRVGRFREKKGKVLVKRNKMTI